MRLNHHNPWELVSGLRRDADRLLHPEALERFTPAIDIFEEDERFVVIADLPGIDAAALELTVDRNLLTIKGERKTREPADGMTRRLAERRRGRFERSFRLPETAASEGFQAEYSDGVLTVSIPKIKEAVPYRIEVTAN